MKCPYCAHLGDKVVDSRESKEGEVIRRRRECLECGKRFTSYERIDEIPYMVVKKDGTPRAVRAPEADRRAAEGVREAAGERRGARGGGRPRRGDAPGAAGEGNRDGRHRRFVMEELKKLDKVAYVRFASVYRHFRDIGEFMSELKDSAEREGMTCQQLMFDVIGHDGSCRSPRRPAASITRRAATTSRRPAPFVRSATTRG